jgi:hypothetical protein
MKLPSRDRRYFYRFSRYCCLLAFFTLTAASLSGAEEAAAKPAKADCTIGPLGTALQWYSDPSVAADVARREGKLVFVIQVSGNFSREEFT